MKHSSEANQQDIPQEEYFLQHFVNTIFCINS